MSFSSNSIFDFCQINAETKQELQALLNDSSSGRARICMHDSPESLIHVSLLILSGCNNIPAHASRSPGKNFYIIESGKIEISVGQAAKNLILSSDDFTSICLDRTEKRVITNISFNPSMYWEINLGPFVETDTIWYKDTH